MVASRSTDDGTPPDAATPADAPPTPLNGGKKAPVPAVVTEVDVDVPVSASSVQLAGLQEAPATIPGLKPRTLLAPNESAPDVVTPMPVSAKPAVALRVEPSPKSDPPSTPGAGGSRDVVSPPKGGIAARPASESNLAAGRGVDTAAIPAVIALKVGKDSGDAERAQDPKPRASAIPGALADEAVDPGQQGAGSAASVQDKRAHHEARSARLFITHVDPWSVMKQSFLLAIALAIMILIAVAALWFALDAAGVLDAITRTATDVGGENGATISSYLEFSKVMGVGLLVAGIEIVLVTVLSTLFAFMYNLSVGIGGGLEVTLSQDQ